MTKRTFKPGGDRVLVKLKPLEQDCEKKSSGGVILEIVTESKLKLEQLAVQEAYIVDFNSDCFRKYDDKPWFQVGDCVLICKYSGADTPELAEGTEDAYRVIHYKDVFGKFEGEEARA